MGEGRSIIGRGRVRICGLGTLTLDVCADWLALGHGAGHRYDVFHIFKHIEGLQQRTSPHSPQHIHLYA